MNCRPLDCFTKKDQINPDRNKYQTSEELLNIMKLTLGVAAQCDNKEHLMNEILTHLDESVQTELMRII